MPSALPSSHAPLHPGAAGAGSRRWAVLVAVLVWLLAGLSVGYWGLQWWASGDTRAVPLPAAPPVELDAQAVARALGGGAPAAAVAPGAAVSGGPGRYSLQGVVAAEGGRSGVALIAAEGQKARPYRVGAEVDGRWRVRSVAARSVELAPLAGTGSALTLSLPQPAGATQQP